MRLTVGTGGAITSSEDLYSAVRAIVRRHVKRVMGQRRPKTIQDIERLEAAVAKRERKAALRQLHRDGVAG